MADENKQTIKELRDIKADLDYIKKRVVDVDIILTPDDMESLEKAEQDLKEGKTKKLS